MFLLRILSLTLVFTATGGIFLAHADLEHKEHFAREVRSVSVVPPDSQPPMTQESIDIALKMFAIEVPDTATHPRLDLNLEDRGLTTLNGWGSKLDVTLGPAAFSSWALLGSTLAHELEVHCLQNFFVIRVKDILGLKGTDEAEREAYLHELANSNRFHLNQNDKINIKATMEYYYPSAQPFDEALSARRKGG
ncbi:hypothetical protein DAPPUDRAFT_346066 [Daphnia pulex]|uniref:Uncharacterized protein n=1 Tax=Daphnia pulex TaxID=6669 RepID=E9I7Q2_DAPPU|nr:hypothetical protein DAPPUDRAFT_346066 [Daphnia pulex]|eukprot:EFX59978.1 hypothetical protein DAPPUDRAFT_346066 [Daphnia pulex]